MSDPYKRLARHLDRLPGGFPATDSGVEIRILKRLFTPDEAHAAVHLNMLLEPAEAIAQRLEKDPQNTAELLQEMSEKGLLLRSTKGAQTLYMAAQFVVGIWEYHVNDLDEDLIRDFNEYAPHIASQVWEKQKTQQLRVIPVSESIAAEMRIMPYEVAEDIINSQSKIVVAPCICRKEHDLIGDACTKPLETCLIFGASAYYYEGNKIGRTITQDEARDILHQGIEAGLVLQPGNSKKPANICMCCGCCCQVLKNLKQFDKPARGVCSSYYAEVSADDCTACGVCSDRCQMEAITIEDIASVDPDRCIGCGLCVPACDFDAMHLVEKADPEKWDPPNTIVDTYVKIAQERGLF